MTRKMIKFFLIGKLALSGAGIIHDKHDPHIHREMRTARMTRNNGSAMA